MCANARNQIDNNIINGQPMTAEGAAVACNDPCRGRIMEEVAACYRGVSTI